MDIYDGPQDLPVQLANKADDSPLTRADLAAHQCICEGLEQITPGVAVVSEESEESQRARQPLGHFWLIDPLDGTKEFLARNGEFTVNIAWVVDGVAAWGVVYAPALDLMYWGGQGGGAWRARAGRSEAIRVAPPVAAGAPRRVVASKSHLNAETRAFIDQLGPVQLIQAGSSLKFCKVAEGQADVYPRLAPTCEWDTAAAQAVLEGAGGRVVDVHGQRLRYGKPDVLNPHFVADSGPVNGLGAAFV